MGTVISLSPVNFATITLMVFLIAGAYAFGMSAYNKKAKGE